MRLLTDNIILKAKKAASVPLNESRFSDDTLIDMLQDVFESELIPLVKKSHGHFNDIRVEVESDQNGYITVPPRAFMRGISKLKLKDNNAFLVETKELTPDRYHCFYFLGNSIVTNHPNQTFELTYTLRPPLLSLQSGTATVVAFNTSTNQCELSNEIYDVTLDFIKQDGYPRYIDVTRTDTISGTIVELPDGITPVVGDIVAPYDTSCLLPVPQELATLAVRMLTTRIFLDLPDQDSYQLSLRVQKELEAGLLEMMKPRTESGRVLTSKPLLHRRMF